MSKSKMDWDKLTEISKKTMKYVSPLTYFITENTEKAIKAMNNGSESSIEKLREAQIRQRITMQMAESQARVAQEVAIAQRIASAEEVKIEEFYDNSGEGSLGVDIKEGSALIGASGSGKAVSKRVYTFKGWGNFKPEEIEQK